jgi:AsmA-like C-terminal region
MSTTAHVKKASWALLALAVLMATAATVMAPRWPFSQRKVTQSLQETFPATVTFQKFHATYFPHPGCVGEEAVFTWLGSSRDTSPIVTIRRITIEAHYLDMILRPGYISKIILEDFAAHVPKIGSKREPSNWKAVQTNTHVGTLIADRSVVEIARNGDQEALQFIVHRLELHSVQGEKPFTYEVALHNPIPPGEIRARGQFGPWNRERPGDTAVSGEATFAHADLSSFDGISGNLTATQKFWGELGHLETEGHLEVPDFMVKRSQHALHLASEFHAFVNGTNGDVSLEHVATDFLRTQVTASGKIAGRPGEKGKTASLALYVRDGRVQDVLRLFVSEAQPPLNGVTSFRAQVTIPPGDEPFLKKVRVAGDFGVSGGEFSKTSTQKDVDLFSGKARGEKISEKEVQDADEDPQRVISNFAGRAEIIQATAKLDKLSFNVPGASAEMHGTYNLETEKIDLHGTLKTDAELSHMTEGVKSALLKPLNIFFKRKHAGAVAPVHLVGTYHHPEPGLDLPGH